MTIPPVLLPLTLASATLALLVYALLRLLPLPPAAREARSRSTWETGLMALLRRELERAGLTRLAPPALATAMVISACLGAAATWPFGSRLLVLTGAIACGAAPYQWVRRRAGARARAVAEAVAPALLQIARICEVRQHPFLALSDAVPLLPPPLKAEFEEALAETQAGLPLPDALRRLAHRNGENFYLHQLAELVELQIKTGGDLAASLTRLANRQRTTAELRAEESAELFGYTWLTRILFGATVLPLPYWAATRSHSLAVFLHEPLAQGVLVWVVLSGLAIISLPYWLALDE